MLSWNPIIEAGKQKTIQILDGNCFEPNYGQGSGETPFSIITCKNFWSQGFFCASLHPAPQKVKRQAGRE
jgi:hypothetical protein